MSFFVPCSFDSRFTPIIRPHEVACVELFQSAEEPFSRWSWYSSTSPHFVGLVVGPYMDVSENSGTHSKPSILGYPYFWQHPYARVVFLLRS